MALTDTSIRAARAKAKPYKLTDDDVVHEPRRLATLRDGDGSLASMYIEIQIPILDEPLGRVVPVQPLAFVGLEIQASLTIDVLNVILDCLHRSHGLQQFDCCECEGCLLNVALQFLETV
jgi:hypothetical protein